jgi:hypothetical protein
MGSRHSIRGLEHTPGPSTPDDLAQRVADGAPRFGTLPPRIAPDDLVESCPSAPAPDPLGGRDPDAEWMLRYGIGMVL